MRLNRRTEQTRTNVCHLPWNLQGSTARTYKGKRCRVLSPSPSATGAAASPDWARCRWRTSTSRSALRAASSCAVCCATLNRRQTFSVSHLHERASYRRLAASSFSVDNTGLHYHTKSAYQKRRCHTASSNAGAVAEALLFSFIRVSPDSLILRQYGNTVFCIPFRSRHALFGGLDR